MRKIKEILIKFPINRLLDYEDIDNHLHQDQPIEDIKQTELMSDLSVIKLNSTFLEVVDVHYKDRGFLSFAILLYFLLVLYFIIDIIFCSIGFDLYPITLSIFTLFYLGYFLKYEFFIYTHYPIRFNRKKQLVHLFRINGEVQTIPWKNIYFTMKVEKPNGLSPKMWYLCGHILDENDKLIVIDTFTVSMYAPQKIYVMRFWELIRRYMEDKNGVKEIADISSWFLPIADQKEPFGIGLRMLVMRSGIIGSTILLPVNIAHAFARWLSFRTSKIPQWTPEVEAQCAIQPDDPYQYDCHSVDMKWYWRYLLFWRYTESIAVTGKRWKR